MRLQARYAFFLPVKVLSRVFRGKFVDGLKQAFRRGKLSFTGALQPLAKETAFRSFLRSLFRADWVVYGKPPFGGPLHVLHYLARYTHGFRSTGWSLLSQTPRCHFQSPARECRRRKSDLPLEGLRAWRQTKVDGGHR
jgi:hypothetical protein